MPSSVDIFFKKQSQYEEEKKPSIPLFPLKTKEKSFLGECKRATVLGKISESQKKEQEAKNKEGAEKAKKKLIGEFCRWFEKIFSLKRQVLSEYTREDRTELFRIFEEEHRGFLDYIVESKFILAFQKMREYYGKEYFPDEDLLYHVRYYSDHYE